MRTIRELQCYPDSAERLRTNRIIGRVMHATNLDVPWNIDTPDLAWVRREVGRFLKPYALDAHAQQRYRARLFHRQLRRAELSVIEYGGEVGIDAGRMSRCYLVQVPLTGSYTLRSCRQPVEVNTRCAHIVYPGMPLDMAWTFDCRVLVLRFEEAAMAACRPQVRRRLFESAAGELIALDAEPNRAFGRIIDYVAREATAGRLFDCAAAATHAENLVLAGLMAALDSDAAQSERESAPVYVRRAEAYLLENLAEDLTVIDVARAASTTQRTLFDGFKRTHGIGPLAWMREQRLERARADLLSARRGEVNVTDVAMRWGFQHLGRFCVAYRSRYGETPATTLYRER